MFVARLALKATTAASLKTGKPWAIQTNGLITRATRRGILWEVNLGCRHG